MNSATIKPPTCDTLVVVPTYCEKETIVELISAVLRSLACDVLVVDDESPDGTARLVQERFADDRRVSLLSRPGLPRGLGCAYRDGFAQAIGAGYSFIFQMDADFSHDPARLPDFRARAEQADLVIGSRYVAGGDTAGFGRWRRALSRGGSWYARLVLGLPIKDVTGGFKCWRAEALAKLNVAATTSSGFAFQIEMNLRACRSGLRIVELPICFADRRRGFSKMSGKIMLEGLAAVWRLRKTRPE